MSAPDWLPELMPYAGEWDPYLEKIFQVFERDFIKPPALFQGLEVRLRWSPIYDDKPSAFWHIISEGKDEAERLPDLRRCERIAWLRAFLDNYKDPRVKVWENERRGNGGVQRQVLLWREDVDFVVILSKRNGYYLLLTGYPTNVAHTRAKLLKEYEAWVALKKGKS